MLSDRGRNCIGEHMEQLSTQDPDLHYVLLHSADLISGAMICESKPQEKGNFVWANAVWAAGRG